MHMTINEDQSLSSVEKPQVERTFNRIYHLLKNGSDPKFVYDTVYEELLQELGDELEVSRVCKQVLDRVRLYKLPLPPGAEIPLEDHVEYKQGYTAYSNKGKNPYNKNTELKKHQYFNSGYLAASIDEYDLNRIKKLSK
jgi:hypothetical protein